MSQPSTSTETQPAAPEEWAQLKRELPEWFRNAPFGIFIHWGAYSVPAWAEPIGALGTVKDPREWFTHNAYAEWYMNTIRIDGSPAQKHHQEVHGGVPYDELLDQWHAENFDPASWAELFKEAGADYVIPTTKHHDGIGLWDAPGTNGRNVVHRGPKQDLIGAIAGAVKEQGMHLGLYYSGGLDWHVRPFPPHMSSDSVHDTDRPRDPGYAQYAYDHVADLIERYRPEILWNDIEWPDAGKHFGPGGLGTLFKEFYAACPTGVVNDRWGSTTHQDYGTSEYEAHKDAESFDAWENCRGIGFSFGYNQVEGTEQSLTGKQLARQLVDVVSRGGRFLLNVGPKADGTIPAIQRQSLTELGAWMAAGKQYLVGATPLDSAVAVPTDEPWIRWIDRGTEIVAFVDSLDESTTATDLAPTGVRLEGATVEGCGATITYDGGKLHVQLLADRVGPAVIRIPRT
ncbi:alpha-L-fucosidase [Arthrobacter sp. GAS37]|uniref:alpha-L-fucosidase n=1 Tax=Arthrobacter sp. GAS37 TaxID=3156261 RepID=UPI00383801E8